MSDAEARPMETDSPRDESGDRILAVVNYVLCFLAIANGLTLLIAAILAYVRKDQAQPWLQSHFRYQIATFWYGLAIFILGFLTVWFLGLGLLIWLGGRRLADRAGGRGPDPACRRTPPGRSRKAFGSKRFPASLRPARTTHPHRS
jgi:uncharacterized membrane protein